MAIPSKEELINTLKEHNVTVKFTKIDGTERSMKCTLREDTVIPYDKKTEVSKAKNDNIVSVWDLEKSAWRSFRYDSVLEVYK